MSETEILELAKHLVAWHNQITPEKCSFYGASMDKALCRDTFSTLYIAGLYGPLKEIEAEFMKP